MPRRATLRDGRSIRRAALLALKAPPNTTISQWADDHRVLTSSQSSRAGPWRTDETPYLRAIMDDLSPSSPVQRVVVMKSARVGWTEAINNVIGGFMHMAPCPIMVVQPSEGDAEEWSKDSLDPMLGSSPVLRGLVTADRARTKGNTILHKRYRGGVIYAVSASTPKSFRRRLARAVLCDEVDGYPGALDGEGDPTKLAEKRADTYTWSKKLGFGSTPTIKGASRIERLFEMSDQRYFHVPCPDCGHMQRLVWDRLVWTPGKPETAEYACVACDTLIPHYKSRLMRARGDWVPTHPQRQTHGYHISALYSPWVTWATLAAEWEEAQGDPSSEQVFVNTVLGETWDAANAEKWDEEAFKLLLRPGLSAVPRRAACVTAGVDVQGDRLVFQSDAWGPHEERWTLERRDLYGDPSAPEVWAELDAALSSRYPLEGGGSIRIRAACVDTAGSHTQAAWNFCRKRRARGVFGIVGRSSPRRVWQKEQRFRNKGGYAPFVVGVDVGKEAIHARLRRSLELARAGQHSGPGFWHFSATLPGTHFDELVSEARVVDYGRTKKGSHERKLRWVLRKSGQRNEGLDISVYSYAALQALLAAGAVDLDRPAKPGTDAPTRQLGGRSPAPASTDPGKLISARSAPETKRAEIKFSPSPVPAVGPSAPPRPPQRRPRPRVATSL